MKKMKVSEMPTGMATAEIAPKIQPSECTSLLGISAFVTNRSPTKLILTFQFYTTQSSTFVEKAAAQRVDADYQLLIGLFSNLHLHDQIFFPTRSPDHNLASLKSLTFSDQNLNISFSKNHVEFLTRSQSKPICSLLSRSQSLPASMKNKKLYRHLQWNRRNGGSPLVAFTLFSKLPPELRVKIWQFSFVRRIIDIDPESMYLDKMLSGKNYTGTPNPVQLLVNQESRAEVKLQYKFSPNWTAQCNFLKPNLAERPLLTPEFGIYFHAEIDELRHSHDQRATSSLWRRWDYCILAREFQDIQTLIIRDAHWTAHDLMRKHCFRPIFHRLREVVIYLGELTIKNKANILHTELGRKQYLSFLKDWFTQAPGLEEDSQITIRVPVFTIHY
ncbi:hypothetical protein DSL72_008873 [Monilinia vaccinii-corymbosi]|uniref:2EXR domain-containing protein n=1 Tax=Monilinia vaccinii-corymbosi TaxID=61207 RepID=A0A8A3PSC9_9HELO|nr:hypothetical protein DSL72_008873 [Monilinia vaccinii-corymbosi]